MRIVTATLLGTGFGLALSASATVVDPNWTETTFSINRDTPNDTSGKQHTGLAWAPDGSDRLFVLEKTGRVRILSGALSGGTPTWSTFATMTPIYTSSECGLIGIAFDPNFAQNRYVYFFVTVSSSEQQILRYDASTNVGTGRTVIRDQLPTSGNNHNGGGIGFAGDGKLYWSVGDNGNGTGVDNNLTSLGTKVGRANRDGTLPADNPFNDGAGPNNDYIFGRGFRNPFTMQIQPSTGQIWLNVVGDGYEQVFVVGRGSHGGYNDYENNQPAPTATENYITPKIVYTTNGSDTRNVTAVSRSGNVATFTTSAAHRFRVGGNLTISGVTDASFNQINLYIASIPSPTTFTAQQVGPDATSAGGTAVTLNQGGCLTGGAFNDATLASAVYAGNFFYGDCNSGRINRARIDGITNAVLSVDYFATGTSSQVDVASGPDGAIYYTGTSTNNIYRAAFTVSNQALVVGNQNLRIDEGGDVVTSVRLATQPAGNVQVATARSSGDTDVSITGGATLTFSTTNWMQPQTVRMTAATDADGVDDLATVSVTSPSLTAVPIRVTVLDLTASDLIFANGFQ
ncbi:MAG: PQQ-dependent sugar dehydrogenase [Tahibacter sp.]